MLHESESPLRRKGGEAARDVLEPLANDIKMSEPLLEVETGNLDPIASADAVDARPDLAALVPAPQRTVVRPGLACAPPQSSCHEKLHGSHDPAEDAQRGRAVQRWSARGLASDPSIMCRKDMHSPLSRFTHSQV